MSDNSGKTPGRPVDPGEAWSLEKLIVLGVVTLGTFLVGLGWSAANVASTAFIADQVDTDIGAVIAGSGVTFTLTGLSSPVEIGPFENEAGLVVWRYRFTDSDWAALSIS